MLSYQCIFGVPDDALVGKLSALCSHVFAVYGPLGFENVDWVLINMPAVSIQTASEDERLVGFKIGYAETPKRYYSYLGGVHETCRRRGIALQLAINQHNTVVGKGYEGIETGAINTNAPMINLNLSLGFHVIGSYCRSDLPRITMYKDL